MFVQVITGRTSDSDGWTRQMERWGDEVRPGATGFLGSTSGVADDGRFVVVARFADEAAARANETRTEQTNWYEEMTKYLSEERFRESTDVGTLLAGGSDAAGFVQVMEGRVSDRARLEAMETPELLDQLRTARPDLIGSLRVWLDGGEFVEVAYFTSEAEARKGEASDDFSDSGEDFVEAMGITSYLDLRHPLFS